MSEFGSIEHVKQLIDDHGDTLESLTAAINVAEELEVEVERWKGIADKAAREPSCVHAVKVVKKALKNSPDKTYKPLEERNVALNRTVKHLQGMVKKEGFVCVPINPTKQMLCHTMGATESGARDSYKAMIGPYLGGGDSDGQD